MDRQGPLPRPSARAAARLTDGVGHELGSLRRSLTDALAEAERLEQAGRTDLAVDVLEEQRLVLARVHDQLMGHVSAAAVEREAEAIVAAVEPATSFVQDFRILDELQLVDSTDTAGTDTAGTDTPSAQGHVEADGRSLAGRVLVSALAAVLGLVLLATPEPEPGRLTIAGRPAADTDAAPTAADGVRGEAQPRAEVAAQQADAPAAPTPVTREIDAVHGPLPSVGTATQVMATSAGPADPAADAPGPGPTEGEDAAPQDEGLEVQEAIEEQLDVVSLDPEAR